MKTYKRKGTRGVLYFGASLACLTISAVAPSVHAQAAGSATASQATPPAADSSEVIVTGTRRASRVQKVPVAISTITSDQIAALGISTPSDLQFAVPAVTFNPQVGAGFQIRGFGTQGFDYNLEKAVAIVVDDVVQGLPRSVGLNTLADVDRVEVLKGPQGTLFGKNASAGVIFVVTGSPKLGVFSDEGSVKYGTRNEMQISNTVNIPLSDTVAARVTTVFQKRDGYLNNKYNGETYGDSQDSGIRAKLLWAPSDNLKINFTAEVQDHRDTGANIIETVRSYVAPVGGVPVGSTTLIDYNQQLTALYGVQFGPGNFDFVNNRPSPLFIKQNSFTAALTYNIGEYTLTSITAYKDQKSGNQADSDFTATDFFGINIGRLKAHQFSQEVRLGSPVGGFFDYVVGAYLFDQEVEAYELQGGSKSVTAFPPPYNGPVGARGNYTATSKSTAFFGQGNFHLTDQLTAIVGGRWTDDKVSSTYFPSTDPSFVFSGTIIPATGAAAEKKNGSGKFTLQYNPATDVMFYATYSQGYKAPAIGTSRGVLSIVKPETVINAELGVKTQWFHRKLTVNVDAFDSKFKNFQTTTSVVGSDNVRRFVLDNAPLVLSKGVEIDVIARPTPKLTLTANYSHNPTEYKGFLTSCYSGQAVNPSAGPGCYLIGTAKVNDVTGLNSINSPETTYNTGFSYSTDLPTGTEFFINGNYNWRSSQYSIAGDPNTIMPAYGLLSGNVGFGLSKYPVRISLYGRNLLDKDFVVRLRALSFSGAGSYVQTQSSESGRTVGVRLDFKM